MSSRWELPLPGTANSSMPIVHARFIPLAGDGGLIIPIGEWVNGEAGQQVKHRRAANHLVLAEIVNQTACRFLKANFPPVRAIHWPLQDTFRSTSNWALPKTC